MNTLLYNHTPRDASRGDAPIARSYRLLNGEKRMLIIVVFIIPSTLPLKQSFERNALLGCSKQERRVPCWTGMFSEVFRVFMWRRVRVLKRIFLSSSFDLIGKSCLSLPGISRALQYHTFRFNRWLCTVTCSGKLGSESFGGERNFPDWT